MLRFVQNQTVVITKNIVGFKLMMERKVSSRKFFSAKNKLMPLDPARKTIKNSSKCSEAYRKIPKVIAELEKNLQVLKKYYEEEENYQLCQFQKSQPKQRKMMRPKSSTSRKFKKTEEESTVVPELEDVKRSFLNFHGYNSNNVVELYNFYKKSMEKSTRLFGSISGVNSTYNCSDFRQNRKHATGFQADSHAEENEIKQSKILQKKEKIGQLAGQLLRKNNELVNVATLLADRKKISRQNICKNINSDFLYSQAKKKLVRPNTMENIERLAQQKKKNENQQNLRKQNIRISPARPQKSSRKKDSEMSGKSIKQRNNKKIEGAFSSPKFEPCINTICDNVAAFSPFGKVQSSKKQNYQKRDPKEGLSAKSKKSGKSLRSPSLNHGIIFECGEFDGGQLGRESKQAKNKICKQLTDSLLQCEISVRENSKVLDLEEIPFEF